MTDEDKIIPYEKNAEMMNKYYTYECSAQSYEEYYDAIKFQLIKTLQEIYEYDDYFSIYDQIMRKVYSESSTQSEDEDITTEDNPESEDETEE